MARKMASQPGTGDPRERKTVEEEAREGLGGKGFRMGSQTTEAQIIVVECSAPDTDFLQAQQLLDQRKSSRTERTTRPPRSHPETPAESFPGRVLPGFPGG